MTKSYQHIIVAFLSVFLFTSCLEYKDVEFLGIDDYKIDKVSGDIVQITLKMKIENPNTYNIKVKKSTFDLYLNGKMLGKAQMKDDMKLLKKSTEVHDVVFESSYQELSKGLFSSLGMLLGGTAKLRIRGKVKAKAFGIGKKFDVDFVEDIKISDLKF
jgi:LEA14-like dessication related protein